MLEIGVRKWVVCSLGYGNGNYWIIISGQDLCTQSTCVCKMQYFWMIPWKSKCMHFALLVHRRTVYAAVLFHTLMICLIYGTTVKCQIWLQVKWHPTGFEQTFCEHAHIQHTGNNAGCRSEMQFCDLLKDHNYLQQKTPLRKKKYISISLWYGLNIWNNILY